MGESELVLQKELVQAVFWFEKNIHACMADDGTATIRWLG